MEIWAHTLVKNDARWLWYSINSVINYVDKILLWDSGSTDISFAIEEDLVKNFPDKIIYKKRLQSNIDDFTVIRQEMLNQTKSDWFLMLDGDEIWWEESIKNVVKVIKSNESNKIESIIVPTINVVGDIFHYQDKNAGRYKFGDRIGHYNLRVVNRNIPGLHSQGVHGTWGWVDVENKMIQNRHKDKIKFIDAPYIHTTFLRRSSNNSDDKKVAKRSKKLKYEFGHKFSKDFYYPEALFIDRPSFIPSPWVTIDKRYKFRAVFETPLRRFNRRFLKNKVGY